MFHRDCHSLWLVAPLSFPTGSVGVHALCCVKKLHLCLKIWNKSRERERECVCVCVCMHVCVCIRTVCCTVCNKNDFAVRLHILS